MSKNSRKKSSKTASSSPTPRKTQVKTRPAKTRGVPAHKSSGNPVKLTSHKATSKRSKSSELTTIAEKDSKTALSKGQNASALSEGQKAPAFRLPRDGGSAVTLADYAGKKLVLFFYPRANTPGCTREAIDFTRLSSAFAKSGTVVLGVSADPPKTQEKFRDKHKLTVPLISDEKHEMLQAYGAWGEKSLYGKKFLGILRTTVLVGTDGKVARIWRNVRVDGHADEVLAAATAL